MTQPTAPVFAPHQERPGPAFATHAPRMLLAGTALVLAACTSTPLPPWPTTGTSTQSSEQAPAAPAQTGIGTITDVTPVVPSSKLEALPYNAAIAQLFPDPPERYSTPGLSEGRRSPTTNAELAELLRTLSQSGQSNASDPRLGLLDHGNAQSGTPILALVAAKAPTISPLALEENGRPSVMIVAGQQGTDTAATEAALVLAKELGAGGQLAPLLDKINIILVPRANPDGFDKGAAATSDGTDLRQDHLQLQTPEARFLAKLARDYRPAILLDAGEFAAIAPTLQRFDAVRANDMGVQYATTPNAHEFVTKAAREWMHEPVAQALKQADLRVDWAFTAAGGNAEAGFAMGGPEPTTLRGASSLKNTASMEILSRGSDLGRTHLQRRVHGHVTAMTAVLQQAAQRASNLRQVGTFVARDVAAKACHGSLTVQGQPRKERRDVMLVDAPTAQLVQKSVAWSNGLSLTSARLRPQACGYWLSPNAVQATERLSMLGVIVQRVGELSPVQVETYQPAAAAAASGAPAVSLIRTTLDATPGSYYVSMNQPLAYLAAAALEPDTPYSYYSTGILGTLNETARVVVPPTIVFEED